MILGEVPQWLVDLGTAAGAIIAVMGVLGALSRTRLIRWFWRHLVSKPVGEWQTKQIEAVVAPLQTEILRVGGALVSHTDFEDDLRIADQADRALRQVEMDNWRKEVRGDIADLRSDIGGTTKAVGVLHRRIDSTLAQMAEGHPPTRNGNSPADEVPSDESKGSPDGS